MSTFTFPTFPYDPLPTPTSIRLLTVRNPLAKAAPTLCGHTLLSCKLYTVDLKDKPNFNCLSYTWGNPNPLDQSKDGTDDPYAPHNQWPISVNGRLFFITKNLYNSLCQLRVDEWSDDAEVDSRFEPYNKTRIIQAAEEGRYIDVEDCIRHGANVLNVDCFGETALHYAAENGHVDIVELLLAHGADRTAVDSTDRTPLDCCVQRKRRRYQEIARILENTSDTSATVSGAVVRHHRSKPIWIDAICVNQNDVLERNIQVSMMTQIYGQAQSVIIWLGGFDSEAGAELYHSLPTILSSSAECFTRSWEAWHRRRKNGESDEDDEEVQNGTILSSESIRIVLEFVRRSYFHRIWVLQEVALARDVRIMFGGDDLPWAALFQVFQSAIDFEYVASDYNMKVIKYRYGDMGTLAWSLADVRLHSRRTKLENSIVTAQLQSLRESNPDFVAMEDSWWHSKLPLATLIALTWNFAATDPRDKIFALLGIAQPVPGEEPIVPDYHKTVTEVFTQVGKAYIQARGDNRYQDWRSGEIEDFEPLEALSFIQDISEYHDGYCWLRPFADTHNLLPRPDDLPSWVPSFHWPLATRRLFSTKFRAGGSSVPHIYPFDSDILWLDALMVDTITNVETQRRDQSHCYCGTPNVLEWLKIMATIDPIYPTGCDRVEALWQVLSANCYLKRAFPLTAYSYAEDPVGEDFADYIKDTLPGELAKHELCDDDGNLAPDTAAWLREVFGQDTSGSLPDIDDVLAAVKNAKVSNDEGEEAEEKTEGDGEGERGDEDESEGRAEGEGAGQERAEKAGESKGAERAGAEASSDVDSRKEDQRGDADEQGQDSDSSAEIVATPEGSEEETGEEEDKKDGQGKDEKEEEEEEEEAEEEEEGRSGVNSFEYFMWCVWPLRRVVSTTKGYLGLVPRVTQAGDQVWLFAGGRTPYILRPTSQPGQYTFIGEAYIHGIMDGEAAEDKYNSFRPVQVV
ncbi:ankyrin and HET domain protein [Cordyceps militaris CM01]|uniref:Ankyrin and HET domain protein n=1 Tax=Cordyceps militaris (strain CM01) TaxID=983644 RepID=G3J407_CORMM|nr:ankyrin and HET domain protein [Cordyceps militaris CM01]EGX95782.1 ankyrin and HET domain protein [Cordyceps militaris CM01]